MSRKAGNSPDYIWSLIDRNSGEVSPGSDIQLPSVTSVIGATLAKPQLYDWYYKMAVQGIEILSEFYSQQHYALPLEDHDLDELLKANRLRPVDIRDEAADRGTAAHAVLEALCQPGTEILDLDESPFIAAVRDWASQKLFQPSGKPRFEQAEQVLYSLYHGFSGTCDLAGFGWVTDLKTRKAGQRAYFSDYVQVAAYGLAREEMTGVPHNKGTVLVVRDDATWQEYPVDMSLRSTFLHLLSVYTAMKEAT